MHATRGVGVRRRHHCGGESDERQQRLQHDVHRHAASGSFAGGGTLLVGKDIQAARYFTMPTGSSCYWEREKGLSGSLSDIITNDFTSGYLQVIVEIASSDVAFKSDSSCGLWGQSAPFGSQSTIRQGQWVVGSQVAPGTYKANPTSSGCYWERRRDFTGSLSGIITNDFVSGTGQQLVTIGPGDTGFVTDGCGAWSSISLSTAPLDVPLRSTGDIFSAWQQHRTGR
jgi:hypothetical protein